MFVLYIIHNYIIYIHKYIIHNWFSFDKNWSRRERDDSSRRERCNIKNKTNSIEHLGFIILNDER